VGPAPLINRLHALHQFSVFSCASTLQRAVALALVAALEPYKGFPSYYKWLAAHYKKKRDHFVDILDSSPGLDPVVPDGAFYVMARHSSGDYEYTPIPEQVAAFISSGQLKIDPATQGRPDYNFVRKLAVERRVVGIPPSAFFCASHWDLDLASNFVRFAFCKEDPVLEESRRRLCRLLD
jgi:kynurenine---oxoglutarate transaminase / cysteine-S-conjugate beta-lyase / glutamine---phenylpyruvate transaminase